MSEFVEGETWLYCLKNHFNNFSQPCQTFTYLPIIPHLISLFSSIYYVIPNDSPPIFTNPVPLLMSLSANTIRISSTCTLASKKELNHNHFSNPDNIAVALAGDGIQVFRKVQHENAMVTPMILVNYNLEP